jgi:hypothetical protein
MVTEKKAARFGRRIRVAVSLTVIGAAQDG